MIKIYLQENFGEYYQQTISINNAVNGSTKSDENRGDCTRIIITEAEMIAMEENNHSKPSRNLPAVLIKARSNERPLGDIFSILGNILNFGSRENKGK